jgi:hypothetical protein
LPHLLPYLYARIAVPAVRAGVRELPPLSRLPQAHCCFLQQYACGCFSGRLRSFMRERCHFLVYPRFTDALYRVGYASNAYTPFQAFAVGLLR